MSDKPGTGFVSLSSLKGKAPTGPAEILAEIRRIYFRTSKETILNDLAHAIELLKSLPDEETREKAHVYMEGLAEMRNQWVRPARKRGPAREPKRGKGKPREPK